MLIAAAATAAIAQDDGAGARATAEPKAVPFVELNAVAEQGRAAAAAARCRHPPLDRDRQSGRLDYTATAGTLSLFDQSGERTAAMFYTAYVVDGADAGASGR